MKIPISAIIQNQPIKNVSTIGHVAHGKSTLVREITGVKTQKRSSELDKNITIDIGFANAKVFVDSLGQFHTAPSNVEFLEDDDGSRMKLVDHFSFTDSPGHQKLLVNMYGAVVTSNMSVLVIATDQQIPQPQTVEHLQAADCFGMKKFVICQNKMDLIEEDDNHERLEEIASLVKGTSAEGCQIIPTVLQKGINVSEVVKSIVNFPIENFQTRCNQPVRMTIIRSFDVNKPHQSYKQLTGGIVGGSLISGVLNTGDYVEIRPGFLFRDPKTKKIKYKPFITRVVSLESGNRPLEKVFPGGLIAIGSQIDPCITKNNRMVGQVLGNIGTLPEVYGNLTLKYELIQHHIDQDTTFKQKEKIKVGIGAMTNDGIVTSFNKKKCLFQIQLVKPLCLDPNEDISVFKYFGDNVPHLVGTAKIIKGEVCERENHDEALYNELLSQQVQQEYVIENDIPELETTGPKHYEDLLDAIKFKDGAKSVLKIVPPVSIFKFPYTIITNFPDVYKGINLTPSDKVSVDYATLLMEFINDELGCLRYNVNGEKQLLLRGRGKFSNSNIEGAIVKFAEKYLKCMSCNSMISYLFKDHRRKLCSKCLVCDSSTCVSK